VCQHIRYDTQKICGLPGTDVDHIDRGDDHRLENLQLLCRWHHNEKSGSEGGNANAARLKARTPQKRSPGLIYDDEPVAYRKRWGGGKRKAPP
jgi:hypothetical protein